MPITPLPPAPQPIDTQAQFNTKAFNLVAALSTFVAETNAVSAEVFTASNTASTAAAAALAAGTSVTGTSSSSLSIGTGNKTLNIETGRAFVAGMLVRIGQAGINANVNYMQGDVISYDANTGALVVSVSKIEGSGTFNAWSVRAMPDNDLYVPGKLSQGVATPLAGLHTFSSITGGAPASSGSAADPNAVARFGASTGVLDVGWYSTGAYWIQARLGSNYATNYDIYLNPNGGSVFTKSIRETRTSPSISAGTLTLDCSAGSVFSVSLNANVTTLTISNVPASGNSFTMILQFTADGTARSVTWPGSVKWASAVTPSLTSTNGKIDVFTLTSHDGGTTWFASTVGQNY